MKNLPNSNSGQALLLVLLSMAVVLTVVLSILSRSITDISITSQEGEALRAFSAAEAGVERALLSGSSGTFSGGFEDSSAFSGEVTEVGEGLTSFTFPITVLSGETLTAWFVSHNADGDLDCSGGLPCFTGNTMKVCWGKEGTPSGDGQTPAIEISVFHTPTGNIADMEVARSAFDPSSGRSSNNFTLSSGGNCTIDDTNFEFSSEISMPAPARNFAGGLQFARIKLFYNTDEPHPIGVDVNYPGGTVLPSQGKEIASTGTAGDANRKIVVFQSFEEVPGIFDTAIFAPGGLVK